MEALKFYKMKLGTGNNNNMTAYRKLRELSKLGKIGLFIYLWCLYLFFIRVNTYSFFKAISTIRAYNSCFDTNQPTSTQKPYLPHLR